MLRILDWDNLPGLVGLAADGCNPAGQEGRRSLVVAGSLLAAGRTRLGLADRSRRADLGHTGVAGRIGPAEVALRSLAVVEAGRQSSQTSRPSYHSSGRWLRGSV